MSEHGKVIVLGAGNIGRGLLAERLSIAGYRPLLVEAVDAFRARLASAGQFTVRLVGRGQRAVRVDNYQMLDPHDRRAMAQAIHECDFAATAVGGQNLPSVAGLLAPGLADRRGVLNILLCENWPDAAADLGRALQEAGAPPERFACVPCSVERMVRRGEGLDLIAEEGASALIDQSAWRGERPALPEMVFTECLTPYYKRKLYTNNAGHAVLAYLGALEGCRLLPEALARAGILGALLELLEVAAEALHLEYGLARAELQAHLQDLVQYRYANRELADPVDRVARQPLRKLGPDERLVGLLRLLQKHHLPVAPVCRIIGAALHYFDPSDEECLRLQRMITEGGAGFVLREVCGFSPEEAAFEQSLNFFERHKRPLTTGINQ